jgi:hypothetical protein
VKTYRTGRSARLGEADAAERCLVRLGRRNRGDFSLVSARKHRRAAHQDRPPPACLPLAAGIQRQPLRGVAPVGGQLPQMPVALFGGRPPHQPRHDASRAGQRVHHRLGRVLRGGDRVEARVVPGLLGRPPQRGHQRGAGRQPRRDDRRPGLAAAGPERTGLVRRVHRGAGQDAADQDRLTVGIVVIVAGLAVAVWPVTGNRWQCRGPPAVAPFGVWEDRGPAVQARLASWGIRSSGRSSGQGRHVMLTSGLGIRAWRWCSGRPEPPAGVAVGANARRGGTGRAGGGRDFPQPAGRGRGGEDGIYFDHRGDCRDSGYHQLASM